MIASRVNKRDCIFMQDRLPYPCALPLSPCFGYSLAGIPSLASALCCRDRNPHSPYLEASICGPSSSQLSELCAFVIDTRGSAKPAPWAHFSHAFGASSDPVTDSAVAERHAPPYLLTPNLL